MARFAGLGLEPILADSDDDDGDMGFRRAGFGLRGGDDRRGKGGGNDAMTDTWQNEIGNIKVNDRGMRVAQRDGQEELLLEGQVVPDQLVFGDGRVIGRGACSVVNLARHKDTGQLFAVKVFSLLDREKRRQLDREIGTLLRSLENGCCSQLVDFFGAFKRPDGSIRVVLEYMDRGSLADVMEYRSAIQSRWNERRDSQLKLDQEAEAEQRQKETGAVIATGLANGHSSSRRMESFSSSDGGGLSRRTPPRIGAAGHQQQQQQQRRQQQQREQEEEEEDDDMPATLERLGAGHHDGGQRERHHHHHHHHHHHDNHSNGGGGRGRGEDAAMGVVGVGGSASGSKSSGSRVSSNNIYKNGSSDGRQSAAPHRMGVNASPRAVVGGKPAPLTEGACATPATDLAEAVLERGRGKVEAPWVQFENQGQTGSGMEPLRLEEESLDPEEAERRRVEAAAELKRQREQEEWDRAFEEELVQTGLPEDVVAACVYQILAGLTYLHEHNQLHRDVKPSNILLNARGEVKLTDFGIARELDHAGAMVETVVGTVRYMSPERLHGEAYGRPADVWGLGLVMIECVTQEAPYADGCSQIEILQTLKEHGGSGLLPSGTEDRVPLSEAFVEFVSDCLSVKPEDRLSTAELLNSQWFIEQGVHGRDEAVELMSEYLEGLYGAHAFKYFGDGTTPDPSALP